MRLKKRNIRDLMWVLIFTSMPLLACMLMCLKEGIRLDEVYIPNSRWNDEIFYYKMIGAIARYDQPLGYFGYNGSVANIGRLGPWSPVLFIFYVIYAKIFGWSMLSPIYCNIILMTGAMAVFAVLVRPTKQQIIFLGLLYCSDTLITRYVFSGMIEISIYALLVIYLGIATRMLRQKDEHNVCYEISLNILAFLLVLMRPYWMFLTLMPGYYWYTRTHKKAVIILESIWSVVSIGLYFFISQNFCAAYYKSIINFDWLRVLFEDPVLGIYNVLHILVSSIWTILQSAGEGVVNGYPVGSIYALYMLMIIYFFYEYYHCIDTRQKYCFSYWLFYFGIMLAAVIYLYDIDVGSRHATSFIFIFGFIFSLSETSKKKYVVFLGAFVWLLCIKATDQYTYQIPIYTSEKAAVLGQGEDELEEAGRFGTDPWDNTIIWLYADETVIDFTYLYALPDGFGIQLYFKENVVEDFHELKPKYIMTNTGEEIDLLCEEKGKREIAEYGNVHVWELR